MPLEERFHSADEETTSDEEQDSWHYNGSPSSCLSTDDFEIYNEESS